MIMLTRLFNSVQTKFSLQKACLESVGRRIHQSTVDNSVQRNVNEIRDEEATKWLSNLSPEMQERKLVVENIVDSIRQEHYDLNEMEISPADMKHMMTECKGKSAMKNYLFFKKKSINAKISDKVKRLEKQKAKQESMANKEVGPSYTIHSASQATRYDTHQRLLSFMYDSVPVVFDLDFAQSTREQTRTVQQIKACSALNKTFPEPCRIHVTSFTKNENFHLDFKAGTSAKDITLHEKGFEELFPLEKLVYLSPDAPQLRYHRPGDIYVIGGLVDLHCNIPVTLKKARQLNIRCGSIPFMRHTISPRMVKATTKYALTLNAVFELVLNINLRHDWGVVMKDFVKARQKGARGNESKNRAMINMRF